MNAEDFDWTGRMLAGSPVPDGCPCLSGLFRPGNGWALLPFRSGMGKDMPYSPGDQGHDGVVQQKADGGSDLSRTETGKRLQTDCLGLSPYAGLSRLRPAKQEQEKSISALLAFVLAARASGRHSSIVRHTERPRLSYWDVLASLPTNGTRPAATSLQWWTPAESPIAA
jgi:hypothetical protein